MWFIQTTILKCTLLEALKEKLEIEPKAMITNPNVHNDMIKINRRITTFHNATDGHYATTMKFRIEIILLLLILAIRINQYLKTSSNLCFISFVYSQLQNSQRYMCTCRVNNGRELGKGLYVYTGPGRLRLGVPEATGPIRLQSQSFGYIKEGYRHYSYVKGI